jgi:hypothetical protein
MQDAIRTQEQLGQRAKIESGLLSVSLSNARNLQHFLNLFSQTSDFVSDVYQLN